MPRLSEAEVVTLARILLVVAILVVISFTTTDPDLWGHVRFGLDIIDDRAIASHDPYSFTSDRSWINHEWLAEVFMGGAYRVFGSIGLVLVKTTVFAAALAFVSLGLRRVSWRPIDHDLLISLAVLGTAARVHDMRPQVFSVALFAAVLLVLIEADRGRRRALLFAPPLMAVWANFHGGWVVGLAILLTWAGVRLIRPLPDGPGRGWLAGVALASVIATLANPYGTGLWSFLLDTVGLSRPGIRDWQPLFDLPVALIVPACVAVLVAVIAVAKVGRRVDWAYLLMVAVLVLATVKVSRNDAFLALAVVMLLGPYLGRERARRTPELELGRRALRRPLPAAIAIVLVGGAVAVGAERDSCIPVRHAPEPQVAALIQKKFPHARMLTFFNWGEYAIWQLGPEAKVSMDGRRETVYSDALFREHVRFYLDRPGSLAFVARLRPDLIWLVRTMPVVPTLVRHGWKPIFRGPSSVVLAPAATATPLVRVRSYPRGSDRCFPDR